jgi:hypothetical protein
MPEHFGLLAAFAVRRHCATIFTPDSRGVSARFIAQELARECIRSVAARYPNDVDGGRPGVQMLDADIIKEAGAFAEYYRDHWPEGQTDSHINCHARCCRYQSDVCSDFATTAVSSQLEAILSETRDAPPLPAVPFVWGFEDDTTRDILDNATRIILTKASA